MLVGKDSLSDVFSLEMSENLHKSVTASANSLGETALKFLRGLSNQIILLRLELADSLISELGQAEHWQPVTTRLISLAILHRKNPEELMELYFQTRMVVTMGLS